MKNFPVINDLKFARKIYLIILIFSLLWVSAAVVTPVLFSSEGVFKGAASFFYIFFSSVCHQDEARSYHILGNVLGVCSRCIWIYSGFFIGTVFYPLIYKLNNSLLPPLWILLTASALVFADSLLDISGIYTNTFLSRSITGFIIGAVLPFYLIPGFIKFFYEVNLFFRRKNLKTQKENL
jgi:uncharacterized membrane protein